MIRGQSHTKSAHPMNLGGGTVQDVVPIFYQLESVGDVLSVVVGGYRMEEWLDVLEDWFNTDDVTMLLYVMYADPKFLAALALDNTLSPIPRMGKLREV